VDTAALNDLGARYARAWCSQDPSRVAGFFSERGSLSVNEGAPAVGRGAIAAVAAGFMRDFPDMIVSIDAVEPQAGGAVFRWTLTGTNTGPGGTGRAVRISGQEVWKLGADGLIAESQGSFDEREYERQLRHGKTS
jgi:uncharacterized protein (TIGR02246 family)